MGYMKMGCNYWASHAGTEMWRQWDPNTVRKDLDILQQHGVEYLRVFPNWRDFQPVEPFYTGGSALREYRLSGERMPENPYFIDEIMLERFEEFCDLCEERGLKLIVGLITGWMSGRCFFPIALNGKNLLTDPTCLYFEQLYVTGLVKRLKHKKAIYAWDHGNECQCMCGVGDYLAAESWTRMVSNAIYAEDRTRPLISGFNALSMHGIWRFSGQADAADILVTHPYPFWGVHTQNDRMNYIRTTMYSAAQTRLYSDLGHKPCLVEEIGTMGPGICDEKFAADYLRVNFFSVYANGGDGLLWWCANDQAHLMTAPYTWTMCENELGMVTQSGTPKPVLKEMKRLSNVMNSLDFDLPKADVDAVCILTRGQDEWGVAYMTYILAKQAGLNLAFADGDEKLPESNVYMLPSISGSESIPKHRYLELKERVRNGATLYISQDDAILSDFENLTGNRILDSECWPYQDTFVLNGKELSCKGKRKLYLENITSEQVQTPYITRHAYGKGQVYFVNFPLEAMLIETNRGFDLHLCEVYREVFKGVVHDHPVRITNENVALTIHRDGNRFYAVAVNHSNTVQNLRFITEASLTKIHYGNPEHCEPLDAVIAEFCM